MKAQNFVDGTIKARKPSPDIQRIKLEGQD